MPEMLLMRSEACLYRVRARAAGPDRVSGGSGEHGHALFSYASAAVSMVSPCLIGVRRDPIAAASLNRFPARRRGQLLASAALSSFASSSASASIACETRLFCALMAAATWSAMFVA